MYMTTLQTKLHLHTAFSLSSTPFIGHVYILRLKLFSGDDKTFLYNVLYTRSPKVLAELMVGLET